LAKKSRQRPVQGDAVLICGVPIRELLANQDSALSKKSRQRWPIVLLFFEILKKPTS